MRTRPRVPSSTSREASVRAARELADHLESGGSPAPVAPPFRLPPGEQCYAYRPVQCSQYATAEVEYLHKTRFALSAAGLAMAAATAAGNGLRKARASREAAAQWRDLGGGHLLVTDRRLMLHHQGTWHSMPYSDLVSLSCDPSALYFQKTDSPPSRLACDAVDYCFVLAYWFTYREVTRPPLASVGQA